MNTFQNTYNGCYTEDCKGDVSWSHDIKQQYYDSIDITEADLLLNKLYIHDVTSVNQESVDGLAKSLCDILKKRKIGICTKRKVSKHAPVP